MKLKLLKFGQEIDAESPKNGNYYVIVEIGGKSHRLSANQEVIQALIERVYQDPDEEEFQQELEDIDDSMPESSTKTSEVSDWEDSDEEDPWDEGEARTGGNVYIKAPRSEEEVPSI